MTPIEKKKESEREKTVMIQDQEFKTKKRPNNITKITIPTHARKNKHPRTEVTRVTAGLDNMAELYSVNAWLSLCVCVTTVSRGREILVIISQGFRLS